MPSSSEQPGRGGCGWLRDAAPKGEWLPWFIIPIIKSSPTLQKAATTTLCPATTIASPSPGSLAGLGKSAADTRDTLRGVGTRSFLTLDSPRWIYWLARPVDSNVCYDCGGDELCVRPSASATPQMAVYDVNIMLTISISLSLPSRPVTPSLRRVLAILVAAKRTSKTEPKTLALEDRTRRNPTTLLSIPISLASSRLALPDSPRAAFDPLLAHVPQPITSFKSLLLWLYEGLEMAGAQFVALCKTRPLGEHEEPNEKSGSDADNGGTLPIRLSFFFFQFR